MSEIKPDGTYTAQFIHVRQPTPFGDQCETIATNDERDHGVTFNRFDSILDEVYIGVSNPGEKPEDVRTVKLQGRQFHMVLAILNKWAAMMPKEGDSDAKH